MCPLRFANESCNGRKNPRVVATLAPQNGATSSTAVLVTINISRRGEICKILHNRPWSHIAIDFLTDLPTSQGFSTILVAIDRFSKACKLKGLPTALETATALFHHVFHNYGLPEDIVSDRGPQFISWVWHAFCRQLGINVSLSSGYHPQSNDQAERLNQEIGRFL
ncbi:hypothetical protein QTP70_029717 [Hemibagrus guttatus]|uniref:Integrase catalytic domain-containing protein n=1 Tax=Hemibagrus guttatus TaxID=175788 RepID=A0AAE0QUQ3_9TELE|nr:hypothetical protein QTP70_029717 [Hemibagrus guttatus]KAK3561123.1 hypothetical protein QTP86_028294 [Hemibagrus guttatus]